MLGIGGSPLSTYGSGVPNIPQSSPPTPAPRAGEPAFNCQRPSVPLCPYDAGVRVDTGCLASPENTNATCSDGVDNDCDGFTDCIDWSCTNTRVVTVCPSTRDAGACVCRGAEATAAACRNGVDDDCDGFVDCADFDCSMHPTLSLCRDGG